MTPPIKIVTSQGLESKFKPAVYKNQEFEGYLAGRMRINLEKRLMTIDLNTLLEPYKNRPGKQEWVGEHVGKFLHAGSLYYSCYENTDLKKRIDYAARGLLHAQMEDGYLGTYVKQNRWTSWDVWSHKYNMIGLLAYHDVCHDEASLEACRKMADLLISVFGMEEDKLDIIASGTHLGMASTSILEPMVKLYAITHQQRYLDFCEYLVDSWGQENGPKIISALLEHGNVYKTANNKAYEMLSCLVGLADLYKITGNESYLQVCKRAWNDIAYHKNYVIGTSSFGEHFTPSGVLRPDGEYRNIKYVGPGEGCVTVTWMQFCHRMLEITGEQKIAEEVEKTVYNALMAAQNPLNGEVCYFLPLQGDRKRYGEVSHGLAPDICCCSSSIPRGIAMIPFLSAGTLNGCPTLLLFNSGYYEFSEHKPKVALQVKTDFPMNGNAQVMVYPEKPADFAIQINVPEWARDFKVQVQGTVYKGKPGSFLRIDRLWNAGDVIKIEFELSAITVSDGHKSDPKFAIKRGPQVLAFDQNISDVFGTPVSGWVGEDKYVFEVNTGAENKRLHMVAFAEAGQTMANYDVLFDRFTIISEKKIKSLQYYRKQLEQLRTRFPVGNLPDINFFQFGMGNRKKILYKDGKLVDLYSGEVLYQWPRKAETIIPNEYKVYIETITDDTVLIYENEERVFIHEGGKVRHIEGTTSPINLPEFNNHPYSEILKVLNHEILINIVEGKPLPNNLVYDNPWRRDAAMMAMCLEATGNLELIRDWVMSLEDPYDRNNAGEMEADNLGQTLFLVSLFSDKNHPVIEKILKEIAKYEVHTREGVYIRGRSDFHETPVYQTKWLKYGLKSLGLNEEYIIPTVQDDYSSLFWWDYKETYWEGTKDAYESYDEKTKHFYPYIGWASDHFHGSSNSPVSNRDYPLSWEQKASQAHYPALTVIDEIYAESNLCAPHTWHAAEMFLYLLNLK